MDTVSFFTIMLSFFAIMLEVEKEVKTLKKENPELRNCS